MSAQEKIKKEISSCMIEARSLGEFLNGEKTDENYSFNVEFQKWYTKAIKIVEFIDSGRLQEFKSYYEIDPKRKSIGYGTYVIQDYLKGVAPNRIAYPDFDTIAQVRLNFFNQYTIINSIIEGLDSVIFNMQSSLYIELQDLELETAKQLSKINLRAAGVISGVVLEQYLRKIIKEHEIKSTKKHLTLSELSEVLKSNNIIDIPTWRKLSYLADIRNICAHDKQLEPSKAQIEELINGTIWVSKNIH